MEWSKFQTYNMATDKAFETLCNQLFENWCNQIYSASIINFNVVNGSGGDGGVESYAELNDGTIIGLQAKCFFYSLDKSQFNQIKNSIITALNIRPNISRYIVCVPRNLSSITGKNKGSNNCEQTRWNEMVDSFKDTYPFLVIELWDEFKIEKELAKFENSGILKFWFQNSILDFNIIKNSFERAKSSWLMTKYVPELNVCGEINTNVLSFLGDKKENKLLIQQFNNILNLCILANNQYISLIDICDDVFKEKLEFLILAFEKIENIISLTEKVIGILSVERDCDFEFDESIYFIDFENIADLLSKTLSYNYHFHYYELKTTLLKLSKFDYYSLVNQFNKIIDKRNLFVFGNPGTGKTQGISAVSELILNEKIHIPLVIQAKYITNDKNWKDIITDYLGLCNFDNEDELWQCLISLANLYKTSINNFDSNIKIIPKVIVFVDALDESIYVDKWEERIAETITITKAYPQIKFCFTSRYKITNSILDKEVKYLKLSDFGDVATYELYDIYLSAYNVKIINNNWLKYSIRTPLMLRIFCENNQNKIIDNLQPIDVSMAKLWRSNIDMIEKEYSNKSGTLIQNQSIFKSILLLSEEFLKVERIKHERCLEILLPIVNRSYDNVEKLINYLSLYGILGSIVQAGNGIEPNEYYYQQGIQGYFDFVESEKILKKYDHPSKIDFNEFNCLKVDTLYALTILSMSEYDFLITQNETINKIDNNWLLEDLQWLGLTNTNYTNGKQYVSKSIEIMSESADGLMTIANKIVLPLSRDVEHPLGVNMLHNYLKSFEKPAHRDMYWSLPNYLNQSYNTRWHISEGLQLLENEYRLSNDDHYNGLPLLYAWCLSSVNNTLRKQYRSNLTKWALENPNEYFKLFINFSSVNDPQIRSELFSILTCIVYEKNDDILLKKIVEWIKENVLCVEKIEMNRDVSIRYYSIAILYKCILRNISSKDELLPYLPPYDVNKNDIDINELAFSGSRMGGYKAIDYDLSRYVLIDPIIYNYSGYSKNNQLEELIKIIGNDDVRLNNITIDQFILGAAYAYLLNTGWNEDDFYNDFRDNSKKGLDSFIRNTYGFATHGSKNSVMTVCEKYIWQFRNYINGFLSDRLLYGDDRIKLTDYGLLDDFTIPIQEIEQIDPDNLPDDNPWYIPEKEKVEINQIATSKDEIINQMKQIPDLDWKKWIIVDNQDGKYKVDSDDLIALNLYSCFYGSTGIETCLFINTLCIDTKDLELFLIQSDNECIKNKLSYPTDWYGGIETSCYITPKEICWFPWKKRYDCFNVNDFDDVHVESAVDECVYNFLEFGDVHYYMPSKQIRELLNITNSNGYLFMDYDGKVKSQYSISGEKWRTAQNYLLADKLNLEEKLKNSNKSIIWLMREYRRESGLSKEKFGEFWVERSNSFIGYFDNNEFIVIKINSEFKSNKEKSQ